MKDEKDLPILPEQYELREAPAYRFTMNRRRFFQVLGSGVAVAWATVQSADGAISAGVKLPEEQVGAWIHVGTDGVISVYSGKAEVGQNIRTSLAQTVAEELHVPVDSIRMILGDTDLTPYDRGTFGSRTTPYMGPQLRKAAATAREIILEMAGRTWKVDRQRLRIENGQVKDMRAGRTAPIGQFTGGKEIVEAVRDDVKVTPATEWKVAGTSVPKVNAASFLTGAHRYTSDIVLPGMLHGKILRPPSYGATLQSIDVSGAEAIDGVIVVRDGDFVGVVAPDTYTADKALKALKAEWKEVAHPGRAQLFEHLKRTASDSRSIANSGNASQAYEHAPVKAHGIFHVDYIAHAPLEPRAGVAEWKGDRLTVWTGTQRPFGVQEALAEVFNMPKERVRVMMPDTGSGYGGKHTGEAGIEAARLAREAGRPVKIVWTREEEFTWAYFRPAGVIEVKAAADRNGKLTAWEFHNYNSGTAGIRTPYRIAAQYIAYHPADTPLRQGSYRALAATANTFAREAIMDDLAAQLQRDPLAFRLANLEDERMIDVLKAAAGRFGWSDYKRTKERGIGLACGTEKGGFVATCAEVEVDRTNGDVRVLRAVTAFECGAVVNPGHLENQIEGAVIQGLGGALFEWIDFRDGKILTAHFSDYRVPRFSDIPQLETVVLDRKDLPSAGAGETPILGIAPAVRNAIADATGKRLFTLPLVPNGLEV